MQIEMRIQIPECDAIWHSHRCELPKILASHAILHSPRTTSPDQWYPRIT
jgi:hypothetical protein